MGKENRRREEGVNGIGSGNRKKLRELVVTLPAPTASASSSNTPRALLRSLVRLPKYCIRKGKEEEDDERQKETEEEEKVAVEFVGPTSMEVDHTSAVKEGEEAADPSGEKLPVLCPFNFSIWVLFILLILC